MPVIWAHVPCRHGREYVVGQARPGAGIQYRRLRYRGRQHRDLGLGYPFDSGQRADDGGQVLVDPDQRVQPFQLDLEPVVIRVDAEDAALRPLRYNPHHVVGPGRGLCARSWLSAR